MRIGNIEAQPGEHAFGFLRGSQVPVGPEPGYPRASVCGR